MTAYFTNIGGQKVFVSRDDGCATDVGSPPCSNRVAAFVIGRTPAERDDFLTITPKCREHLMELSESAFILEGTCVVGLGALR